MADNVSMGSFVVTHGSGRRQRQARFGCTVCRDLKVKRPACCCELAATRFAAILGHGTTVVRNGLVLFVYREAA